MQQIHSQDGKELGSIPLSERSRDLLDIGERVTMLYHTPQLLRDRLGVRSGHLVLYKDGEQIKTDDVPQLVEFLQIQAAIKAVQGDD